MSNIDVLHIVDAFDKTLFDDAAYVIPLYQRSFAWTEKEICQLIDDINGFKAERYYLGSLIVNKNADSKFETIDGQQRLTALFLLLKVLGYDVKKGGLSFECREKSNFTLDMLADSSDDSVDEIARLHDDKIEQSLWAGRMIIKSKFFDDRDKIDIDEFKRRLEKVRLLRIELPPHTDLNRYFEIMNVRGEQLEQHDIIKAKLMSSLDEIERAAFAAVWDACRDMRGYVQTHLPKEYAEAVFGCGLDNFDIDQSAVFAHKADDREEGRQKIADIISAAALDRADDSSDDGDNQRFDSVIDFPHFLLHILIVFSKFGNQGDGGSDGNPKKDAVSESERLDDTTLLQTFDKKFEGAADKRAFARGFIACLLKCRALFDKFIIKRENTNDAADLDEDDGNWSLKQLCVSSQEKKKRYYKDTEFGNDPNLHDETLMLQACLRVSYPSPKTMHWLTRSLEWLYDGYSGGGAVDLSKFAAAIEDIAKEPCRKFLDEGNFKQGVGTSRIIFNYLDFLLWKSDKTSAADFAFKFRNSVEHWYPQHPSAQTFDNWDDIDGSGKCVDRFGNLCLVSRKVNSRFSNMIPTSKKESNKNIIESGSLKLRKMSELTVDNYKWKEKGGDCERHEIEMLNVLSLACRGKEYVPLTTD